MGGGLYGASVFGGRSIFRRRSPMRPEGKIVTVLELPQRNGPSRRQPGTVTLCLPGREESAGM